MARGSRAVAVGTLIAIAVAGCGAGSGGREAGAAAAATHPPGAQAPRALPAGWGRVRLPSGAALPYPAGWRAIPGDPGSASAALSDSAGTIRAYLNATPADRRESLADWARFRVAHNAAEGDRAVRLINPRASVRFGAGRASCIVDGYATSRSRYRELACIVAPATGARATVLIGAAQPRAWAQELPLLRFAIDNYQFAS